MERNEIALQIFIGLIIGIIIYVLASWALNSDVKGFTTKETEKSLIFEPIFDGFYDCSSLIDKSYNTSNPIIYNYKNITPSVNLKGGAQFSYSMWFYVDNPALATNIDIFLHGDAKKYPYTVKDIKKNITKQYLDYVAICPLLSFGENPLDFNVTFNTQSNMKQTLYIVNKQSDNSIYRKNVTTVVAKSWFLVTVVFEDNKPINDFENGINVKFYLNNFLHTSAFFKGTLKQNKGDLVLFPNSKPLPGFKMSNFYYYNYALTQAQVNEVYIKGPSNFPANTVETSILPYYITEYNKIELANS